MEARGFYQVSSLFFLFSFRPLLTVSGATNLARLDWTLLTWLSTTTWHSTWIPETETQILMLAQKALYPLSHLPSPAGVEMANPCRMMIVLFRFMEIVFSGCWSLAPIRIPELFGEDLWSKWEFFSSVVLGDLVMYFYHCVLSAPIKELADWPCLPGGLPVEQN